MTRDPTTTDRLRTLISKIESLTESRQLHWERQAGSAHRYARWNGIPRYLFVTPFDSPNCIEVNTDDADLGVAVMKLARTVEDLSAHEPATDPFAVTEQLLERLESM
jgi:hypothetical protein